MIFAEILARLRPTGQISGHKVYITVLIDFFGFKSFVDTSNRAFSENFTVTRKNTCDYYR